MLKKLHPTQKRMIITNVELSVVIAMELISRLGYVYILAIGLPFMIYRLGAWYLFN